MQIVFGRHFKKQTLKRREGIIGNRMVITPLKLPYGVAINAITETSTADTLSSNRYMYDHLGCVQNKIFILNKNLQKVSIFKYNNL